MIELTQTVHNLIGSEKAIKELETKTNPRLLVISDSHGKYSVLVEIIKNFGPECDALIFCGDGAMDFAMLFEEAENDGKLKKAIPPVAALVQGNGDYSKIEVNFGTKIFAIPSRQTLKAGNKNFMIVHGHREGVNYGFNQLGLEAKLEDCKYIFYGHTHVAAQNRIDDFTFINPGSCSLPRSGQPQCFAIATVVKNTIDIANIQIKPTLKGKFEYSIFNPIY